MEPDSPALPVPTKRSIEPLSNVMQRFHADLAQRQEPDIAVHEIVTYFGDRGMGALLFVFGAPMAIPLPMIPGVSFIFSLPLLVLSCLMMAGASKPWLPPFLADKRISTQWTAKALQVCIPVLQKIEKYSRPRAAWMLSDLAYRWSGLVSALMAISIMFPLPFSNAGPGLAIVVMAIGRVMHDGVMILGGALFGLLYCFVLYYSSYKLVVATIHGILRLIGIDPGV